MADGSYNEQKGETIKDKYDELMQARQAVLDCLEDGSVLVGMHGLAYWAGRVEDLRKEIREAL